jgi:membrane dipeptidase
MRLLAVGLTCAQLLSPQRTVPEEEVTRVHKSALIIDTHNDVPMKTLRGYDIAQPAPKGSTDIPRLRSGNVGATFFAAYVPASHAKKGTSAEYCRKMIGTIRNDIAGRHPNDFVLARTADEILAARRQGKIAALIGIEGGHAIEDNLENLREFFQLGVRYMTLTHSNTNNWADSSGDRDKAGVKHHNGLTAFGNQVVAEMNRLGMMVDISHVADKTFWDVLAVSRAPVFASHSSCRAISNHHRNMTDNMIKAMAAKGGVIQINFACDFLNEQRRVASPALKKELQKKCASDMDLCRELLERNPKLPRATLSDVVAHIDHVVKIAGIDAVGIGSDFDGVDCTPLGLEDVSKFPALTRALLEKGYTAPQIRKIYGENTLRLMRQVERAATTQAPANRSADQRPR